MAEDKFKVGDIAISISPTETRLLPVLRGVPLKVIQVDDSVLYPDQLLTFKLPRHDKLYIGKIGRSDLFKKVELTQLEKIIFNIDE